MGTAIFVGLPRDSVRRIESYLGADKVKVVAPWKVKFIPAKRSIPEIHQHDVALTLATAAKSDSPHVIAVSKQDKLLKQPVAKAIRPYFRFRWLDNALLSRLNDVAQFVAGVNSVLEEEADWSAKVKPGDILSPLILPQSCFEADGSNAARMWELAEQYGDAGAIIGAQRCVDAFRARHWLPAESGGRRWTDSVDRVFDHTGPRHGQAPFPRNWKLSLQMESGFHYDVTTSHGRPFTFADVHGIAHKVQQGQHLNVDPHGHVRTS